jgi:hypothetical protein
VIYAHSAASRTAKREERELRNDLKKPAEQEQMMGAVNWGLYNLYWRHGEVIELGQ